MCRTFNNVFGEIAVHDLQEERYSNFMKKGKDTKGNDFRFANLER